MGRIVIIFSLFLLVVSPFAALAGAQSSYPEIAGVMGIDPPLAESCAAIWLAIPEGKALAGVEWFNNDSEVTFPGLYFESGVPEAPMALEETVLAASDVAGLSVGWSEVIFEQPVTCASSGLYVIFRFPENIQVTAAGQGGGPAIGYVADGQGAPGWLCSDGESYDKVGGEYGFAVLPVLVDAAPGMLQLLGGGPGVEMVEMVEPLVTELRAPYPNPFNPETMLAFSLAEAGDVDLSVFDLRGRLVARLAQGFHEAGKYSVAWKGMDSSNRRVSSGVYFVRFKAGDVGDTQRLVMVK